MSYEPRSLNPNIMEKRINDLSKAVGGGGIGTIPIASADTVGGIMIGGSANPITITGSGNASVRKATSELLGVVKAGDGISVDADGAISGIAYSTTEHKTGRTWIDGSVIYEKSVIYENIAIEKDTAFNICDATGIAIVFPGEFYSTGEGGGNNLATWITDGYVKGKSCATYSSGTVTVTITYTKTE